MKNADMPAMPAPEDMDGHYLTPVSMKNFVQHSGLTKREHFAGLAMQGLLSNHQLVIDMTAAGLKGDEFKRVIAITAIQSADALLAELERPQCP